MKPSHNSCKLLTAESLAKGCPICGASVANERAYCDNCGHPTWDLPSGYQHRKVEAQNPVHVPYGQDIADKPLTIAGRVLALLIFTVIGIPSIVFGCAFILFASHFAGNFTLGLECLVTGGALLLVLVAAFR